MIKRFRRISFASLLFLFVFSCTKIDTTQVGSDLIPVVDNVNTFADTLDIVTTQGVFQDTTKVSRLDLHVLGKITSDPLLGETQANVYLQLKPIFYPYFYGQPKDTIDPALAPGTGFDSVILCLSYKGMWGDSTRPIQLQAVEVSKNIGNINALWDSIKQVKDINYAPISSGFLGSTTVDVRTLKNYTVYQNHRDSSRNQIRIRLTGLEPSLFQRDTLTNNSFRSDALFREYNNGIGVIANAGDGLMYIGLSDVDTKLEVHYRSKNGGNIDTTYSTLRLITTISDSTLVPSSTADNIIRTRPPLPSGDQDLLIQTQPGTYAELSIPGLTGYSNRIVHRASINIEQVPDNWFYDSAFSAPTFLYMDLKDTGTTDKWKPIYFDLNPNEAYDPDNKSSLPIYPIGGVDFGYFGGYQQHKLNSSGQNIVYYNFNLTRHVQQIATRQTANYKFRLFSPSKFVYPQYSPYYYPLNGSLNVLAYGRLKVAGGNHPTEKMKLIVIYSVLH